MVFLKWQQGRQNATYKKILIARMFKFDVWLIKYHEGSKISWHKDPVDKGSHHRINIEIKKPESGGKFYCLGGFYKFCRLVYFRPDTYWHMVSEIKRGNRLVLSIGWISGSRK